MSLINVITFEDLKKMKIFVCWDEKSYRKEPHIKHHKRPLNPVNGYDASIKIKRDLAIYSVAVSNAPKWGGGIGLVIPEGYFGIDIDGIAKQL